MKIHYLWHSEFIVEMKNSKWKTKKILVDSWLSDFVLWDMMERNPKLKIDYSKLDIDAIFLSHSHSDHLDPYTLVEIYKNIIPRPLLLIPETIKFLIPLFKKYLPKQKIEILKSQKVFDFDWISIEWIVFENDYLTNEDDVMTLAIYNDEDLLFTDIDTVPPENIEATQILVDLFTKKDFKNRLYINTRNELTWNFKIIWTNNIQKRKEILDEYIEERSREIEYNFFRFEEYLEWVIDIQDLPWFLKAVIGQWIIHPNKDFLKLRSITLEKSVEIEKSLMPLYSKNYPIIAFKPWCSYEIINGKFIEVDFIDCIKVDLSDKELDINAPIFKIDKFWPLDSRLWNYKAQEQKILDMLNNKFLPYRFWNSWDNLKNAILNSKNHRYIVKIYYWNLENFFERNYYFDFSSLKFKEEKWKHEGFNEDYWANDLEDFLEWRQDLYSNFWHKLTEWKTYRVWTMLWANFVNNDIVYKKYDFHFKRAINNRDINSYVLKYIKDRI